MAKISDELKLTDTQIDELMSSVARCRIATVGPGTDINLTPMTFGWAEGKVYIFGRGQKIANLRRSPTATILVDVGESWRSLKGIMMRGRARVIESAEEESQDVALAAAQLNLGQKHNLRSGNEVMLYTASASGKSRRWIVFQPESVVTWNNEQLDSSS